MAPTEIGTVTATCPTSAVLTGGGYTSDGSLTVRESRRSNEPGTWTVTAVNDSGFNVSFVAFAECTE
ncbi:MULTISPECIES: hypothetical protein [Streptomyces]|uniref:hypothetical protein n=1 Tax=Streptomyces TaxID=1883 RepID=UPI00142FA5CE|nr:MULTISPECIES: hypothetical protein [Streptomyces]MCH0558982.1 hypothetical protein [Streptomyces sp. MUM 16J]